MSFSFPSGWGGLGGPATRLPLLGLLFAIGVPAAAWAAGGGPSTCASICTGTYSSTLCRVSGDVHVVSGSQVDCQWRAIEVPTGARLLVHDGAATLRGSSLSVADGGKIEGDCPLNATIPSFTITVSGAISVSGTGGSKISSRCGLGGGTVQLTAGGAVSLGALGVDVGGSSTNADGGTFEVLAEGAVTTSAAIRASVTGGVAKGGHIALSGSSITIGDELIAAGSGTTDGEPGGSISLESLGDVTFNTGTWIVDAGTSTGDGGSIEIDAVGTVRVRRPLKVRGTGAGSSGGSVEIHAGAAEIDADILATGLAYGGGIEVNTRGGSLVVGGNASGNFDLDASGAEGGVVRLTSTGHDVTVQSSARLKATDGGSGARGGRVVVNAVDVVTATSSQLVADGPSNGGGRVLLQARGAMTLSGTVRATNGQIWLQYRSAAPTVGSAVVAPYTAKQNTDLPAACGDGVVRVGGSEACDDNDLTNATCVSLGFTGGGALRCSTACAYDTAACVP